MRKGFVLRRLLTWFREWWYLSQAVSAFALVVTLTTFSAAAADAPAPIHLSFAATTVSVTSITPGADVYLFSVAREPQGFYNTIAYRESLLHDTGKTGRVDYSLGQPVPFRSIWFAVDLTRGVATAATPPGYQTQAIDLDAKHLKQDIDGDIAAFYVDGAFVDVVVVRPGTGVWGATVSMNTDNDERSNPHGVTISAAKLQGRVGTDSPPPTKLKKGDVVLLLNSYLASYAYQTVGGAK
jgi:hypothetical protein